MKCLVLIMALLIGACCETKYVTRCPAPQIVPVPAYQTANLPETISGAAMVKFMLTDLITCQDTEQQLRVILKGYEKLEMVK